MCYNEIYGMLKTGTAPRTETRQAAIPEMGKDAVSLSWLFANC